MMDDWRSAIKNNMQIKKTLAHTQCPFCALRPGIYEPPCPTALCRKNPEHWLCGKCIDFLLASEDPIQDQCSWCQLPVGKKEWDTCLDAAKKPAQKANLKQDVASKKARRENAQLRDQLKDAVDDTAEQLGADLLRKQDISLAQAVDVVEEHIKVVDAETSEVCTQKGTTVELPTIGDAAEMLGVDEVESDDGKQPEPQTQQGWLARLGDMLLDGMKAIGHMVSNLLDHIFRSPLFRNVIVKLAISIVKRCLA